MNINKMDKVLESKRLVSHNSGHFKIEYYPMVKKFEGRNIVANIL